jgi:hypothetical protein
MAKLLVLASLSLANGYLVAPVARRAAVAMMAPSEDDVVASYDVAAFRVLPHRPSRSAWL